MKTNNMLLIAFLIMIFCFAEFKHWDCDEKLSEAQEIALEWGTQLEALLIEKNNRLRRKGFDLVSDRTGVAFDYDNQTHHGWVRGLLNETFRGGKR